jgi:hypothetical protein
MGFVAMKSDWSIAIPCFAASSTKASSKGLVDKIW